MTGDRPPHAGPCRCPRCLAAALADAAAHPLSFHRTIRQLERDAGQAAYDAWRATAPAHVFDDQGVVPA